MRSPSELRAIAAGIAKHYPGDAAQLRSFAAFLEDVEGAKKRKFEMIANMPESRAAMFQRTIAFHQDHQRAAEELAESRRLIIAELLIAMGQAVELMGKMAAKVQKDWPDVKQTAPPS